jgi:hypothetical protein
MAMLGQDLHAHTTYGLSVTVTLFGAVMSQKVWWPRDGTVLIGASLDDAIPTLSGGPLAKVCWSGRHQVELIGIEAGVEGGLLEPESTWDWSNGQGVEARLELVPREHGSYRHRQFQGDAALLLMMLMMLVGVGQANYLWHTLAPAPHSPVMIEQAPDRFVVMNVPSPVAYDAPSDENAPAGPSHRPGPLAAPGPALAAADTGAAVESKRLFEAQGLRYNQPEPSHQVFSSDNITPVGQALSAEGPGSIHRAAVKMARLGQLDEALSLLERHSVRDSSDPYLDLTRAKIFAMMGKKARAYRFLRRALRHAAARSVMLRHRLQADMSEDAAFDGLRRERRFERLVTLGSAHG